MKPVLRTVIGAFSLRYWILAGIALEVALVCFGVFPRARFAFLPIVTIVHLSPMFMMNREFSRREKITIAAGAIGLILYIGIFASRHNTADLHTDRAIVFECVWAVLMLAMIWRLGDLKCREVV